MLGGAQRGFGGHFKMVRRAVHVSSQNSVTYFKLSFNLKTLSNPIFSAESKKVAWQPAGLLFFSLSSMELKKKKPKQAKTPQVILGKPHLIQFIILLHCYSNFIGALERRVQKAYNVKQRLEIFFFQITPNKGKKLFYDCAPFKHCSFSN